MRDPFADELGIHVEALDADRCRVRVPFREGNANPGGALHGGAVAALIDTTGAPASRSLVPLDPGLKASTPALRRPPRRGARRGRLGRGGHPAAQRRAVRQRGTVRGAASGRLIATGSVLYRIVVPAS